jgi:hypothetical protein
MSESLRPIAADTAKLLHELATLKAENQRLRLELKAERRVVHRLRAEKQSWQLLMRKTL